MGHEGFGKAIPCQCQQQALERDKQEWFLQFSNVGVLSAVNFHNTKRDGRSKNADDQVRFRTAYDAAIEYAESPQGWLTLIGASGTGKTHLAVAIVNRSLELGRPGFFSLVPDLLDHLRGAFYPDNQFPHDELFERVKTVPLLVLDDLGTQRSTQWAEEKLFQVLSHRYINALPTVITMNSRLEQIEGRLRSRLSDENTSQVFDLGSSGTGGASTIGVPDREMLSRMSFDQFEIQGKLLNSRDRETLSAALTAAQAFAEGPEGWLLLAGDSGCGKTHLAIAVINVVLARGDSVFFAFVPDLLDHLRYTFNPDSLVTYDELFDQVRQAPLLVLDDLGAESSTPWAHEKLYQIIVHRHNNRLPTVITTRGIPTNPKDPVASRLNDPRLVTVMPITAPDFRRGMRRQLPKSK